MLRLRITRIREISDRQMVESANADTLACFLATNLAQ